MTDKTYVEKFYIFMFIFNIWTKNLKNITIEVIGDRIGVCSCVVLCTFMLVSFLSTKSLIIVCDRIEIEACWFDMLSFDVYKS